LPDAAAEQVFPEWMVYPRKIVESKEFSLVISIFFGTIDDVLCVVPFFHIRAVL